VCFQWSNREKEVKKKGSDGISICIPYECLKIGKWIFLIPVIGMLTQSKFHKEFTTWFIDHTFLNPKANCWVCLAQKLDHEFRCSCSCNDNNLIRI
jgi:hypothetical protein